MKKAFDQTVRDIKRGVNKKVLKVPGVEQKVLDATSNEPWGPHGTLLADIAQASRNYHEYQMIMQVIWKRINDTGKNWRHVYKGLTVLEYMVAHGSERVIDDIREHAYQISTLSDFQYIDSNGRDQGSNVRKKSQTLVLLVNDKERIQEVRQKAAANRDKFRNTSTGGMYRPGSGGYGDDRYGARDDYRNGYGKEKDWGDERYGRDGDRYSRDSDERYGRDDDYRGRSQSDDGYRYSSRSRSSDRDRDRSFEDDGQYSSRANGAKVDDRSQDGSISGKGLARKFSEPNFNSPPSFEEAVGDARSPVHSESQRGEEISAAPVPKVTAPASTSPSQTEVTSGASAHCSAASPPPASHSSPASLSAPVSASVKKEIESFDEFDPRSSTAVAPATSSSAETDLFGSFSDSFSSNPLAIVPVEFTTSADSSENFSTGTTFSAAPSASQPFDDPFGDGPFRAISTTNTASQPQNEAPTSSFMSSSGVPQSTNSYGQVPPTSFPSFAPQGFIVSNKYVDILEDILPISGPSPSVPSQTASPPQTVSMNGYSSQRGQHGLQTNFQSPGQPEALPGLAVQTNSVAQTGPSPHPPQQTANYYGNYLQQQQAQAAPRMAYHQLAPVAPTQQYNNSNFVPQTSQGSFMPTAPSSTALALVPQRTKDNKFETKSAVWTDTLSRGLVNLNISGSKTSPMADIGVDFDALNRREKRMEKPTTSAVTSTITMGKAMVSGSGIGRAAAGALRPSPNSIVTPQMGMNQPNAGMNMGMNQNMSMGMRVNPNMGMGQGRGLMQPMGFSRGPNMSGGYNPTYTQQQPYGGGYR